METRQFLDFLGIIEKLKSNTRHSYTADGVHEVVAAHTWRIATMAMLLDQEFPELDMNKVIRMCLIHDWGEAVTGDIPSFDKTAEHEEVEKQAVDGLLQMLPEGAYAELGALFAEMEELKTKEARFYKALDKLEAVISHNESDINTWIPLEYELQMVAATEEVKGFPFLEELRTLMKEDTKEKIARSKVYSEGSL
ncbi:MAG: HD domain-containing protein [Lachnospiraceae bacterium]